MILAGALAKRLLKGQQIRPQDLQIFGVVMGKISHARISKSLVDKLDPGDIIRDTEVTGFGVRRQTGAPVYFLQKRVKGVRRWIKIGTHGSGWTADKARKEAQSILGAIADGEDPATAKIIDRDRSRVSDAAELFLQHHGPKLKPRTREEYERLFKLHILPTFGHRRVHEINRTDVARFHAERSATKAGANFALACLSKFMSWAEEHGLRPENSNPCRRVKKYAAVKRERYLTAEEFARLGAELDRVDAESEESPFVTAALRLLILTGARLNEVLTLKWSFVDVERGLLFLPDSKTGQKTIRLSDAAITILTALPRLTGNPYVLPGRIEGQRLINLQKPWRRIRERAGLDDVRIHDLRHSFASVAAASGGSLPMIGKLLGHTQPQTTARYAHLADDPVDQLNRRVGVIIAEAMAARGAPK